MSRHELLTDTRVAWLIPSMKLGFCWIALLEEFTRIFPATKVFTGLEPINYSPDQVSFNLNVIGKTRFLKMGRTELRYDKVIIIPPLVIPFHLLKFLPQVIFTYGFSIWTIIALMLKPFIRWRVITVYEGSTPTVDANESMFRVFERKLITRMSDAFITNTHAGKSYLVEFLKAKKELVFVRPYLVPDLNNLSEKKVDVKKLLKYSKRPVFLYVGQIIQRKGLEFLIEAFAVLKSKGYEDFTLVILGDGPQRRKLENMVEGVGIQKQVKFIGWVEYNSLAYFFDFSDIFVFPTFEDTWGLVVLEAMACGKPVLCSELAGAVEMVKNGENGFTFNPAHAKPEELANIIKKFMDDPNLVERMGEQSKKNVFVSYPRSRC